MQDRIQNYETWFSVSYGTNQQLVVLTCLR
jgi:hypothetical protein